MLTPVETFAQNIPCAFVKLKPDLFLNPLCMIIVTSQPIVLL